MVTCCFRVRSDFKEDGFIFLKNGVLCIDEDKVMFLFIFDHCVNRLPEEAVLFIRLDRTDIHISLTKSRSKGGNHTMGRVRFRGFFDDKIGWDEQITFKMELPEYNRLVALLQSL